ncbi:hypothetical protein [Microbacterium sp. LEMMJ01]|nr:hypothetical protein [Microbacterium sp. LEMMJ01]
MDADDERAGGLLTPTVVGLALAMFSAAVTVASPILESAFWPQ